MAVHIIESGPWPSGTTVEAYRRRSPIPGSGRNPANEALVDSETVVADLSVAIAGLAYDAEYWGIGQDAQGNYRWVGFRTDPEPTDPPYKSRMAVNLKDYEAVG